VDVALRVGGDRRDVVNAIESHRRSIVAKAASLTAMPAEPRPERFSAPASYGIGGARGELLEWRDVELWLAPARNYWVATVRADGRSHAMPVWGVWLDGAVWFSTDPVSLKGRNIARDPRIVIHLESGDEVAILEGVAES